VEYYHIVSNVNKSVSNTMIAFHWWNLSYSNTFNFFISLPR